MRTIAHTGWCWCLSCAVSSLFIFVFGYIAWRSSVSRSVTKHQSITLCFYTQTNTIPTVWLYCFWEGKCVSVGHNAFDIFCTVFWPQVSEPWRLTSDWLFVLLCICTFFFQFPTRNKNNFWTLWHNEQQWAVVYTEVILTIASLPLKVTTFILGNI